MKRRNRAFLQLLAAAVLFSTGGAAIKLCAMSSWQIAGLRSAFAALAILVFLPSSRVRWSWRALLVGTTYALTVVAFVHANKLTTAANAIFLQATAPLHLTYLAPLLLREPARRRDVLLMIWLLAGLTCFFAFAETPTETAPAPILGNLIAAFSGLCYSLTLLGLRWLGRREGASQGGAAVVSGNVLGFVACLPAMGSLAEASAVDWVAVIYLGTFQLGLGYVLVTVALRTVSALEAGVVLIAEPALNPWWAWWLHGERPGPMTWVGGIVILVGALAKSLLESWGRPKADARLTADTSTGDRP